MNLRATLAFVGLTVIALGLSISASEAQPLEKSLAFELASIKIAGQDGNFSSYMKGGPGTSDPERIDYHRVKLRTVLLVAFDTIPIPEGQLVTPDWMSSQLYDIVAKVPPGATKQQANDMMLNLLKERFHLNLHHEMRQANGYEFTIAKGGFKPKESAYPDAVKATAAQISYVDNDFPLVEPGYAAMALKVYNGQAFLAARTQSATLLCAVELMGMGESSTRTPFADKTGLTGAYDVNVKFGWPTRDGDPPGGPSVAEIFEKQLGLHVEKKRVIVDMVIVDSAEKVPIDN